MPADVGEVVIAMIVKGLIVHDAAGDLSPTDREPWSAWTAKASKRSVRLWAQLPQKHIKSTALPLKFGSRHGIRQTAILPAFADRDSKVRGGRPPGISRTSPTFNRRVLIPLPELIESRSFR